MRWSDRPMPTRGSPKALRAILSERGSIVHDYGAQHVARIPAPRAVRSIIGSVGCGQLLSILDIRGIS